MKRLIGFLLFSLAFAPSAFAQSVGGTFTLTSTPSVLTDGSTITVPCPTQTGSATFYLTLTGANHQILFPSCPASANGLVC